MIIHSLKNKIKVTSNLNIAEIIKKIIKEKLNSGVQFI